MAYSRSIATRASLLVRRVHPSFSYVLHDDDRKRHSLDEHQSQRRSFGSSSNISSGFGAFLRERGCSDFSLSPGRTGLSFYRYMSTTIGDGSDKIEYMTDVADVIAESTVEAVASQASAVSEVAIAAADSYFPVAALQYVIDGVHSFTGLNWWASIALTTLIIRGATIPLLINQLKATTKLTLMRPHLEEIKQQVQDKGMDVVEGNQRMQKIFKEYGVSPFTPMKGLFIQGPVFVSFFLGISNMAEKVPSFKTGGAFWFTDLTSPDTLYILPVLTALTFLINVEFNMQEGMEGNPIAGTMKKFSRGVAVLTVPFTMHFPKAIFCYWLTSNVFSFMYGLVLKRPGVKNWLGVPEIPVQPPSTTPAQPAFSLASVLEKYKAATQAREPPRLPPSMPTLQSSKPPSNQKTSSSSVISQRIRNLEKQVKAKKKNKKR